MAKSDLCAPAFIFLFYADVCQTRKAKQAEQQSSQLGEELSSTILWTDSIFLSSKTGKPFMKYCNKIQ